MSGDEDEFRRNFPVSRETSDRLRIYVTLLRKWNGRINLVSPKSIEAVWTRHILDSAQVFRLMPDKPTKFVDLGSGGGFPGAVVAILASERSILNATLIEADQRKAAFLRTVARETGAQFDVISDRSENVEPLEADVVSARAVSPLAGLLGMAAPHIAPGGIGIFPKGASVEEEIREALETWSFDCERYPSRTDPQAVILKVGAIERV